MDGRTKKGAPPTFHFLSQLIFDARKLRPQLFQTSAAEAPAKWRRSLGVFVRNSGESVRNGRGKPFNTVLEQLPFFKSALKKRNDDRLSPDESTVTSFVHLIFAKTFAVWQLFVVLGVHCGVGYFHSNNRT